MQIKRSTVAIGDEGPRQDEQNTFLRSHKVLDVVNRQVPNERGACGQSPVSDLVDMAHHRMELTEFLKPTQLPLI